MKILYLNNYRGFNESFVEIGDINFLIGENSTGKTSVLKILRSLLTVDFWTKDDLSLSISDLGYFNEITSSGSDGNNSYFEVGLLDTEVESGVKLKYIESNGYPLISEISIVNRLINAEFINLKNEAKFRYKETPLKEEENFTHFFKNWVKKNLLGTEKFIEISEEKDDFSISFPLFLRLLMELNRELETNKINFNFFTFGKDFFWFSPIRSNPRRVYDNPNSPHSPDGSHTPFLLRNYLQQTGDEAKKKKKQKIEFILGKFGMDSGLFESVSIFQYEKSITAPFQLQITIGGKKLNFTNVGYGVSQILPLLTEIIIGSNNSIFSIQQPEVHLHPKGQAAFADFILKAHLVENKSFIIETHSDYLIDRFRILLSKKNKNDEKKSKLESQIIFFTRGMNGNQMNSIPINIDGTYAIELPSEYRNFFIKEQIELLDI